MNRICGACSTANEPEAFACTTCGEELNPTHLAQPIKPAHEQQQYAGALETDASAAATVPTVAEPENAVPAWTPSFAPNLLDDDRHLEGIGGWLVLVAIGEVLSPFVLLFSMFRTYLPIIANPRVWTYLQSKPGLHALVLFEAASNLIFLFLCVGILYLFFARKRSFPIFMVLYLGTHALVLVADLVFAHMLMPNTPLQSANSVIRGVVGAAIWIPYMFVSRRVKVTFMR